VDKALDNSSGSHRYSPSWLENTKIKAENASGREFFNGIDGYCNDPPLVGKPCISHCIKVLRLAS
jgi:hypothetical protein